MGRQDRSDGHNTNPRPDGMSINQTVHLLAEELTIWG